MNKRLPDNTIILISGAPGIGKTTISHLLLSAFPELLMIEETDIIREILLGYDEYLSINKINSLNELCDHNVILDYEMALEQCHIMKASIRNIILRQQRKGIPTIINGVHIIPEVLYDYLDFPNVIYVILYTDTKRELEKHYMSRNDNKHPKSLSLTFDMNKKLFRRSSDLIGHKKNVFVINISSLSASDVNDIIAKQLKNFYDS